MTFQTLSIDLQNLMLVQHSYISKWLLFFIIIFLSIFYIFVVWKNQKPTKYFTKVVIRLFLMGLSCSYLSVSPYLLLLMTPEYTFNEFFTLPIIMYSILISIIGIILFVDFLRYGVFVMLELGGLDLKNQDVKEIVSQIKNNKHLIKQRRKKW